jgi:hypothetical protein
LSILNRAQNDPIFQRTEAKKHLVRMAPIKTLFGSHGANHAQGVVEAWQVCDTTGAACSDASPRHFLFYLVRWESAHFRIGNRAVFPGNLQTDPISGRPAAGGSGLFLNRFLRCRLNLAADISAGNLDPDLVRNLDCQR